MAPNRSIKLIGIDLDGTYLTDWDHAHPDNKAAITACQRQGVKVCACTGRMWHEARKVVREAGFDHLIVTSNGASVVDTRTDNFFYKQHLEKEMLRAIIEAGAETQSGVLIFCSDVLYGYGPTTAGLHERKIKLDYGPEIDWYDVIILDDMDQLAEKAGERAEKVVINSADDHVLFDILPEQLLRIGPMELTTSNKGNLEVLAAGATKATALAAIAGHYGIDASEVMVMGDNQNDMSMFEWAGVSVAVENALDVVKQAATAVTAANTEGGVAKAIYEMVLD